MLFSRSHHNFLSYLEEDVNVPVKYFGLETPEELSTHIEALDEVAIDGCRPVPISFAEKLHIEEFSSSTPPFHLTFRQ